MGFLEKFGWARKKGEESAKRQEVLEDPKVAGLVEKLKEFSNGIEKEMLTEQSGDDYIKTMMELAAMRLTAGQSKEILLTHRTVMEKLRVAGKLREFTGALDKRGRLRTLGQTIDKIVEAQKVG